MNNPQSPPMSPLEQLLTDTIVSRVMDNLRNKGDVITRSAVEELLKNSDSTILEAVNKAIQQANSSISNSLGSFRQEISDKLSQVTREEKTRIIELRDYRLTDKDGNPRVVNVGKQHPKFEDLVTLCRCRLPVYIFGPTGSGKTYATKLLAEKILNVPFYRKVMSSQSGESALMGYGNANGGYVEGIAYRAYKDGGVLLVDEIDNGNANINTVIKMLNDGETCYFPVIGNVPKHRDFYIIANANTVGDGATRQYVGRAPQDKAMLNTFCYLEWKYDKDFERELAWGEYETSGGSDRKEFDTTLESLFRLRDAGNELKLDYILSTRNILQAIRLHAQMPNPTKEQKQLILRAAVCRGTPKEQFLKILEKANSMRSMVVYGSKDVDVELVGDNDKCPI